MVEVGFCKVFVRI